MCVCGGGGSVPGSVLHRVTRGNGSRVRMTIRTVGKLTFSIETSCYNRVAKAPSLTVITVSFPTPRIAIDASLPPVVAGGHGLNVIVGVKV